MSTEPHTAVYFPPRKYTDVVNHYNDVSFHLHKVVLHHHSDVLGAMIDALDDNTKQPTSDEQPTKRQRTCSCQSDKPCLSFEPMRARLDWSKLISAPQDSWATIDADAMELFFCHLYFPDYYPYPPYVPLHEPDLASVHTYTTLYPDDFSFMVLDRLLHMNDEAVAAAEKCESPTANPWAAVRYEAASTDTATRTAQQSPALVYLAHYFGARELWERCEWILRKISKTYAVAWLHLAVAIEYKWKALKKECMRVIASNATMLTSEQYTTVKRHDVLLINELLEYYWKQQMCEADDEKSDDSDSDSD